MSLRGSTGEGWDPRGGLTSACSSPPARDIGSMDDDRPLFSTFRPEDNAASTQPGHGATPLQPPRAEQPPEQRDAQGRVGRGAAKGPAPQLPTPALSATCRYRVLTPKPLQGPSSTAHRPGPSPTPQAQPPRLHTGAGGAGSSHPPPPGGGHEGAQGGSRASSGTLCPASPRAPAPVCFLPGAAGVAPARGGRAAGAGGPVGTHQAVVRADAGQEAGGRGRAPSLVPRLHQPQVSRGRPRHKEGGWGGQGNWGSFAHPPRPAGRRSSCCGTGRRAASWCASARAPWASSCPTGEGPQPGELGPSPCHHR